MGLGEKVRNEYGSRSRKFLRQGVAYGSMVGAGLFGSVPQHSHGQLYQRPTQMVNYGMNLSREEYRARISNDLYTLSPELRERENDPMFIKVLDDLTTLVKEGYGYMGPSVVDSHLSRLETGTAVQSEIEGYISQVPQKDYHDTLRAMLIGDNPLYLKEDNAVRAKEVIEKVKKIPADWYSVKVGDTYRVADVLSREYGKWFTSLQDTQKELVMQAIIRENPNTGYSTHGDEFGIEIPLERRYQIYDYGNRHQSLIFIPKRALFSQNYLNNQRQYLAQHVEQNTRN